jgi:hypothetical protein
MAKKPIIIEKEALETLKRLRGAQQNLQLEVGGIEAHKSKLLGEFHKVTAELTAAMVSLEEKHGKGTVNLDSGEFTLEEPPKDANS